MSEKAEESGPIVSIIRGTARLFKALLESFSLDLTATPQTPKRVGLKNLYKPHLRELRSYQESEEKQICVCMCVLGVGGVGLSTS